MHFKMYAVLFSAAAIMLAACDRSERSQQVGAVPTYDQYGVVTSPLTGARLDQPNIEGQAGVTTATTASSEDAATTERLGNRPEGQASAGGETQTTGAQPAETAPAQGTPAPQGAAQGQPADAAAPAAD